LTGGTPVSLAVHGRVDGVYLAGVGELPLNEQLALFATLGAMRSTVHLGASSGTSTTQRATKPMFGAGLAWALNTTLSLRATLEQFQTGRFDAAPGFSQALETGRVNLLSLGLDAAF